MSYHSYTVPRFLLAVTACLLIGLSAAKAQRLSSYVNTLRGTNNDKGDYSRGGTQPLTTLPNGFAYWTPFTDAETSSWLYEYGDTTLQGFGATHIPSPWINDYAGFSLMPELGALVVKNKDRAAAFSHSNETAMAHYYSVKLNNGISVEMTPATHASVMRITYPQSSGAQLLFDSRNKDTGTITIDRTANTISGYVYDPNLAWFQSIPNLYVYITVSKPISSVSYPKGSGVCAGAGFASTMAGEQVTLRIGTSYISVAQAKASLDAEVGTKPFDSVKEEGAKTWDAFLGKIAVTGGTPDQKTTFYSCLYRSYVYPTSFCETVNGVPKYYSPSDGKVHDGKFYTNNGFWDTYKAAWPLYNLLTPTLSGDMLGGFLSFYQTAGVVSRWFGPGLNGSMLGTHSDILFADAYLKGIRNFDIKLAYQNMLQNATTPSGPPLTGRNDAARAMYYGYTAEDPAGASASASWTLENSICDAAIARLAAAGGRTADATYFGNRSKNYVNLFSSSVGGFFRGRQLNGSWRTADADFHPNEWGYENIEGNSWQYRIATLHDGQGLADLFGSRNALATAIDGVFNASREYLTGSYGGVIHEMKEGYDANMGQYVHANQTDHGMIYMYNYAGAPAKTALHARDVMAKLYSPGTGTGNGYSGDEDNGSNSAWYVFSALGFFPAGGAVPEYLIGSPLFTTAAVTLENGKTFTVKTINNSAANLYVQSVTLNGAAYTRNFITHADVVKGGTLTLTMGSQPSAWGTGKNDVPTSVTTGDTIQYARDAATGGTITASSEAGTGTAKEAAFDNSSDTRWSATGTTGWIQYVLPAPKPVTLYTVTSSGKGAAVDPQSWTLKGSADGINWVTLDTQNNVSFQWRQQLLPFIIKRPKAYAYYRLEVTANGGGKSVDIAEIELFTPGTGVPADGKSVVIAQRK